MDETHKAGEFVWISAARIGETLREEMSGDRQADSYPARCKEAMVPRIPNHPLLAQRLTRRSRAAGDLAVYCLVRLLVAVIQTLPLDMGDTICRSLARLAAGPLRIRQQVTEENLQRVFPRADSRSRQQLAEAMWHHLLLMVCEIAWAQRRLHRTNWSRHVTFLQNRTVLRLLLGTRPIVQVTGHFGNFELCGYVTGLMGFSTLTIARKLDNPYLNAWVERFRGAKGQRMVDKEGCAAEVQRHLAQGGVLSLLADQHAGPKGCWVNFLGIPASCHKALALFTLSSRAPMMVGATWRVGGRPMQFLCACTGIADPANDHESVCTSVTALTRWYNERLAISIGEAVEQYWWLHRRWRDRVERTQPKAEADSKHRRAG